MIQASGELFDDLDAFECLPCALETFFSLEVVRRNSRAQPVNRSQKGKVLELEAFAADKGIGSAVYEMQLTLLPRISMYGIFYCTSGALLFRLGRISPSSELSAALSPPSGRLAIAWRSKGESGLGSCLA